MEGFKAWIAAGDGVDSSECASKSGPDHSDSLSFELDVGGEGEEDMMKRGACIL